MMLENRYAVIDLGTNTFNLLVTETNNEGEWQPIFNERIKVQLGQNGIETIGVEPFRRGVDAMLHFQNNLEELEVKHVRALGTAALRTATNGQDFIREVQVKTGISIDLISGEEEARLIHKGVVQTLPDTSERVLIVDIGGGSMECVISEQEKILWSESFPVGVVILFNKYQQQDIIEESEEEELTQFLIEKLSSLLLALQKYPTKIIVGASGTLETLEALLPRVQEWEGAMELEIEKFYHLFPKIICSSSTQRHEMLPDVPHRVKMMVVEFVLIKKVFEYAKATTLLSSSYAMKEGTIKEMIKFE